mmetsp:Transcript_64674/g.140877  ORF Transcript_64674/g.140877 Transcript_64674/m.140877 type:complete len:233 (+) Transcript_64674:83-781(+)|eukprot:CAMPEP_0170576798 /NCGR_PEP_ID=MMETSP0224-20130122/4583_1 /TAXON_ID=285029 /ORGANISM="Togula jolla, Strain CCCM 725" /LENGTH=232 /DNA_ID=CAMNT_0010899661 /DNA_START=80 /DNA_END=778 /DNA_ORIENTATION=+
MAKQARWKKKFKELDINGDGLLSAEELHSFLKKGNPDMTRRETEMLFRTLDKSGDGLINFSEFVDYVMGGCEAAVEKVKSSHPKAHPVQVDSALEKEGIDWMVVEKTFLAFSGRDGQMDGMEFARLCRQCGLIDSTDFQSHDVEIVFAETCIPTTRKLTKKEFRLAMKAVAKRKHCPASMIRGQVAACKGPVLEGVTRAAAPQLVSMERLDKRRPTFDSVAMQAMHSVGAVA